MSVTIRRATDRSPYRAVPDARHPAVAVALAKPTGPLTYLVPSGANVWPAALSRLWRRLVRRR